MKKLSLNEQIFLIAIWRLNGDAYGVNIRRLIMELTGAPMLFGTLYNTLDYLVKKAYVKTRRGEVAARRGGHNKVYYSLTPSGLLALKKSRELQERLWAGIRELSGEL